MCLDIKWRVCVLFVLCIIPIGNAIHCYDFPDSDSVTCSYSCCYHPEKGDELSCCDDDYEYRSKIAFSFTCLSVALFFVMAIMGFCALKTPKPTPVGISSTTPVAYRNGGQHVQIGYPTQPLVPAAPTQQYYPPPAYPGTG